jgi:hypothetical protein
MGTQLMKKQAALSGYLIAGVALTLLFGFAFLKGRVR